MNTRFIWNSLGKPEVDVIKNLGHYYLGLDFRSVHRGCRHVLTRHRSLLIRRQFHHTATFFRRPRGSVTCNRWRLMGPCLSATNNWWRHWWTLCRWTAHCVTIGLLRRSVTTTCGRRRFLTTTRLRCACDSWNQRVKTWEICQSLGPWWWSSGQLPCLLRSEFKSC